MEKDKLAKPLESKARLKKLEEEYTIILYNIIVYIKKDLGQSIERQQIISEDLDKFRRKCSTKISIPKAAALKMGYGNEKFIEVRRIVNSKFHIYEEYEIEKDGVKQIFFLIEPEIISKPEKPNEKATRYSETISEEVKKYLRKLPKDEYDNLCEQIRIDEMIEIPITLPEQIHLPTLYKYQKSHKTVFKNITGFRRPHANSEVRKQGYNLYVKVTGLDF